MEEKLLETAISAARAGADVLQRYFRRDGLRVSRKGQNDFVTEADQASEAAVLAEIHRSFPDHRIVAEEGGAADLNQDSEHEWLVDPLDGTTNFLQGLPVWSVSVACRRAGRLVAGVVLDPEGDNLFAARRGGGATWNGAPMIVSDVERTADGMIVFGDVEAWAGTELAERFHGLAHAAKRNRGFGDFWGHMLVARGAAEAMIEPELSEWDFAPLVPILTEAGGRVTQLDGTPPTHGGSLLSSNGRVHDEVIAALGIGDGP